MSDEPSRPTIEELIDRSFGTPEAKAAYEQGVADTRARLLCDAGLHPRSQWSRTASGCWTCKHFARMNACPHPEPYIAKWAGILGYRYYCKCGRLMSGYEPPGGGTV